VVTPWPMGGPLHLVLACPPFGLRTADVYRRVVALARPESGAALKKAVQAGDAKAIGRRLHNRLQEPALALRPELTDWLGQLAAQKPLGQLVSGSGSTLFALARDAADARRIAAAIRPTMTAAGGRVHVARTL
jgi:4-diphosphocytidyl-2-C-methyl-D-erythritol kinase